MPCFFQKPLSEVTQAGLNAVPNEAKATLILSAAKRLVVCKSEKSKPSSNCFILTFHPAVQTVKWTPKFASDESFNAEAISRKP